MGNQQEIGARIKGLIVRLGYSQSSAASRAGISRQHMSEIVRGAKSPRIDTVEKIVRGLGATLADLDQAGPGIGDVRLPYRSPGSDAF